ncbi:hypothetical protein [Pseudodesulfovibrio sp. zrk46]|uniref:hypothetical protein n=1 Tax=Pseudodesulfovibrio sp. zrk46 TaxID=2725288 RepID=UPI001449732F|nr:hypothetical protein [Pseudodesulfovibrio sp. zrk46]QJB55312.1 hypothetical protein HFN16_02370 [Pseudodesulfovibrio sp. zrk46]
MWVFYASLQAALDLKRTCRKCKHSQLIKLIQRGKAVTCKKCGAEIPAPKPYERG